MHRLASTSYGRPEHIHTYIYIYIYTHTYTHIHMHRLASTSYGRPENKSTRRSAPVALPILRKPRRQWAREESSLQAQRIPSQDESAMDLSRSSRTSLNVRPSTSMSRTGYNDSDGANILRLSSTAFTSSMGRRDSFTQQQKSGDFDHTQRTRSGSMLSMDGATKIPSMNASNSESNERTRSGSMQKIDVPVQNPWQLAVKFQAHTRGLCMCLFSKEDKVT